MKKLIQFIKQFITRWQARKHVKDWEKRVKRVDQLSEEDRKLWYEEQEEMQKSWYGE